MSIMRVLRNSVILCHRYLGIPLSFMFVLWFLSAFVMIYAGGMPRITPDMRTEAAAPLALDRVNLSPLQATDTIGFEPGAASLRMLLGRPVYDFSEQGAPGPFVFADDGELLDALTQDQARQVAAEFLDIPATELNFVAMINDVDQWTLTLRGELPFYKYSVDDGRGTEVYVSVNHARVSVYTTRQSRLLAWLGTIPHWLYFKDLRLNQPLWYDIVVWSAGIGCVLALLGLILSVTQFRKVRPFKLARAIPYHGAMRWHYILGSVFGVVTLTWVFSGLLSMEPFDWTRARGLSLDRNVYGQAGLDLQAYPVIDAGQWDGLVVGDIKQIDYAWIQERPFYLASYTPPMGVERVKRERLHQPYQILGQAEASNVLISMPEFRVHDSFDIADLVARLDAAAPDAQVVSYELLQEYDDYFYSRNGQLPLPVLRVKFDDPMQSWFYVDPRRSQVLSMVHKSSRMERWFYNGLHSLDFAFWYHKRPLWDIGVILLLLGGLGISCLGLWLGLRRARYDLLALIARIKTASSTSKEIADAIT